MKRCKNCGELKPLSAFCKDRTLTCRYCKAELRKPGIHAAREAVEQRQREWHEQGIRQCGMCGELKPVAQFNVRKASKDGLAHRCKACVDEVRRQWTLQHPDAHQQWYQENKEHKAAYWAKWRESNKDRLAAEYKKWAAANKHIVNALVAKRVARKKQAVASWIDHDAVRAIYAQAAELTAQTGIRHEVDHIVPLQGELVSGLHWEGNLQILTKTENLRKKNKFTADPATC